LGLKIEALYDAGSYSELQERVQHTIDYLESCSSTEAIFPTMWELGDGRIVFYYTPHTVLLHVFNDEMLNICEKQQY